MVGWVDWDRVDPLPPHAATVSPAAAKTTMTTKSLAGFLVMTEPRLQQSRSNTPTSVRWEVDLAEAWALRNPGEPPAGTTARSLPSTILGRAMLRVEVVESAPH